MLFAIPGGKSDVYPAKSLMKPFRDAKLHKPCVGGSSPLIATWGFINEILGDSRRDWIRDTGLGYTFETGTFPVPFWRFFHASS